MTRLLPLLVALALCSSAAQARTITVRSGEHPGFTRLVLDTGATASWSISRVDGGFAFRLAGGSDTYDLTRAFERIPRSRVAELSDHGGGMLFIASSCDCHAEARDVGGGFVALDIVDGSDTADTGASPPHGSAPNAAPRDGPAPPTALALPLPGLPTPPDPAPQTPDSETVGPAPPARSPARATGAAAEAALLEQISRAAAQGLLAADIPASPPAPAADATARPPPAPPPAPTQGHVSVTTSVDNASRPAPTEPVLQTHGCQDDSLFTVADWGHPPGAGSQIGQYRNAIIGEFDTPRGAAVTALARHYVYLTFGAEARAVIARYPDDLEHPEILSMLAEIMDRGQASAAASVADQMACPGPVALWATAAQPALHPQQAIDTRAVRTAFIALPAHLRRHIGPDLAAKFLALGDRETSDALRAATARAAPEPAPPLDLLAARSDLADGAPEAARLTLDRIMSVAGEDLPDVLVERVAAARAQGTAVSEDTIALIRSVRFERRGTPAGAALAQAELRALASAARYGEAFDLLDTLRAGDAPDASPDTDPLTNELFAHLVANAGDADFLARSIPRLAIAATLPDAVRRDAAKRLIHLGFPAQAREVLIASSPATSPEDRLLLAGVALSERQPRATVGYLAGLDSPEAARLRAAALALAKDHAGAMAGYAAIGEEDAALAEAWRGGAWDDLAERGDTPFARAAALMRADNAPPVAAEAPPLARGNALIVDSRRTRDILEAILSQTSPAGPPDHGEPPR